ncbi:hypothetical protein [Helicobacter rodentium]|nr:hypothetical protein [Helicobacter rodentium]
MIAWDSSLRELQRNPWHSIIQIKSKFKDSIKFHTKSLQTTQKPIQCRL